MHKPDYSASTPSSYTFVESACVTVLPRLGELPDEFTVTPTLSDLNCSVSYTEDRCVLAQAIRRTMGEAGLRYRNLAVGSLEVDIQLANGQWLKCEHDGLDIVEAFDAHESIPYHPVHIWLDRRA